MAHSIKIIINFCALVLLLNGCAIGTRATAQQPVAAKIPVVLSTDVGNEVDDQWTIAWLLLSPRVETLGIMSAQAPTIAAPAGRTSYRILRDVVENRLAMRVHPPLIEGGSLPMEEARTPRPSPAVSFLIERSKPFTKENRLTVLMIGAGTDVASAILTVRANVTLARLGALACRGGVINRAREAEAAGRFVNSLRVRCASTEQPVANLSGGNQQKVVIARWLWRDADVLLFDEPTRGIDVGAKFEIYALLADLAAQGKAIVIASSELEELMALCDRIAVLSAGKLIRTFARGECSQDKIMNAALSGHGVAINAGENRAEGKNDG